MHAEQLRHLIEHDDDADTRFEAGQHWLRDEVGQKTDTQDGGQHEHDADQQGERGCCAHHSAGSAPGATKARLAPVRIAIVVVVLTLSTGELPSTA